MYLQFSFYILYFVKISSEWRPGSSERVKYGDRYFEVNLEKWADGGSDLESDDDYIPIYYHESVSEVEVHREEDVEGDEPDETLHDNY